MQDKKEKHTFNEMRTCELGGKKSEEVKDEDTMAGEEKAPVNI